MEKSSSDQQNKRVSNKTYVQQVAKLHVPTTIVVRKENFGTFLDQTQQQGHEKISWVGDKGKSTFTKNQ